MRYIEDSFDFEKTVDFIQTAGLCEPPLVYAIVWNATGAVVGHVVFHPYEDCDYEIGWILNRDYWGMGIADEVTEALVRHAKELGAESCVIECDPEQTASRRIAIRNGFAFEGKSASLDCYRRIL